MEIIDNISKTLRDDLSVEIKQGSKETSSDSTNTVIEQNEICNQISDNKTIDDISNPESPISLSFIDLFENLGTLYNDFSKKIIDTLTAIITSPLIQGIETFLSNFEKWLQTVDISPLIDILENLINIETDFDYEEVYKSFLKAIYDAKWFPYAGLIADMSLLSEVNEIIASTREASKNREKRIDKAILSYYTITEIRNIKNSWRKSNLDYCTRKILSQAINSYIRGEYALTISCLSTMWEGLIYIKAKDVEPTERKRQCMDKTKKELKELIKFNDDELIFSDYFDKFIVSNCNEVNDVIDGVPNRHGVAHSWYRKYPNKKAALNAILLTDFIINLKPIEQAEEKDNGQT